MRVPVAHEYTRRLRHPFPFLVRLPRRQERIIGSSMRTEIEPPTGNHRLSVMSVSMRRGPGGSALFNLNMRVGTMGKQFTAPELRAALEAAGSNAVSVTNTYGYFSLTMGHKP